MYVKKKFFPDENAWLVQYVIHYLKTVNYGNKNLWTSLEEYFAGFSFECEYLYEPKGKIVLYPILSFDSQKGLVKLEGVEFMSEELVKLKMTNYLNEKAPIVDLDHNMVKTTTTVTQSKYQAEVSGNDSLIEVEPKRGFWARLFGLKPKAVKHVETETGFKYQYKSKTDLSEAIKLLAEINEIDLHQAQELLYKTNYESYFNKQKFVSTLEKLQELDLETPKIYLDLQFLYESNFFQPEENAVFKKVLPFDLIVELEFKVKNKEIPIPQDLRDSQLIKLK